MSKQNVRWVDRKDKTSVVMIGRYKVLEIFKRPGKFWCCMIFSKGTMIESRGYFTSQFPQKHFAVRWGCKRLRELGIWK